MSGSVNWTTDLPSYQWSIHGALSSHFITKKLAADWAAKDNTRESTWAKTVNARMFATCLSIDCFGWEARWKVSPLVAATFGLHQWAHLWNSTNSPRHKAPKQKKDTVISLTDAAVSATGSWLKLSMHTDFHGQILNRAAVLNEMCPVSSVIDFF